MSAELAGLVFVFGIVLWVVALFILSWADMSARRRQDALVNRPETYGGSPPWERESNVTDDEWDDYEFLGDER